MTDFHIDGWRCIPVNFRRRRQEIWPHHSLRIAYNPDMNEQAKKATKRTRRWLKVSLRTFLLAITVLCVWLGFIVNRANKQKQAVAWIRENGGWVYYDFEWNDQTRTVKHAEPSGADWLRDWIGIDYFADVSFVYVVWYKTDDIAPLSPLTDLRGLRLNATRVTDLSPLCKMTKLQSLDITNMQVSDLSPLTAMTDMRDINFRGTMISDLSPLAGMQALQRLDLHDTSVSDISPLTGMTKLRSLDLGGTYVSDILPLTGNTEMQYLDLRGTNVSDISPLTGMTEMQYLDLSESQVSNLSPLVDMNRLNEVNLVETPVSDLSPLTATGVKWIFVDRNQQVKIPPTLKSIVVRVPR